MFLPEFDKAMLCEQNNHHHIATVGEHAIRSVENMNAFFYGQKITDEKTAHCEWAKTAANNIKKLVAPLSEKQHSILCVTMLLHDIGKPETKTTEDKKRTKG